MQAKIIELVKGLFGSQQRLTQAIIDDLEKLDKRIRRIESYIELVEERRNNELKKKENNGTL